MTSHRAAVAVLSLALGLSAAPALARQTPAAFPARPALIVTVVVDQFSANLFNQHRAGFTGGLRTLADRGLIYANGYQAHAQTETCPGHATILTGVHPTRAGIPANDWIDRETGQEVYCLAAPENTLAHGRITDNGPVGPGNLKVETLGDWLKAVSPQSRVYAVSGKDRGAITLAGHNGDGAFWYTDGFGFTTYVEPGESASEKLTEVAAVNSRIVARLAANPPGWDYTDDACRVLESDWTIGGQPFRSALPPQHFKLDTSPLLDELTLEAATALLEDQQLGRRGVTDMLGVSLSATDRIGHAFGTQGPEMCEQMRRLDTALGAFLERVAAVQGPVVLVLTADHGGADFPERSEARGFPDAVRADQKIIADINVQLKERFNLADSPLTHGASGLMAVGEGDRGLPQPLRDQVAAAAVELLRPNPQIAGAWTQAEVLASPLPPATLSPQELSLLQRERLSVVPVNSPDIIVAWVTNITPGRGRVGGSISGHGTPWDYDRKVPIIFWTPGADGPGQERFMAISTIDIAPTLANLVGLQTPEAIDGRCLTLDLPGAPECPRP